MRQSSNLSLRILAAPAETSPTRVLADREVSVAIDELAYHTSLDIDLEALRGRSVLISTGRQLPTALAVTELDGIARRILLCTPDVSEPDLMSAVADAEVDTLVWDGVGLGRNVVEAVPVVVRCLDRLREITPPDDGSIETEWVLFTSGTTGSPKLVVHTLSSLTASFRDGVGVAAEAAVWSSFYDIRRYGGLQILLRALLGGGSMILSDASEPVDSFLARAGAGGVTHMSGTPSHWRRALMSATTGNCSPGPMSPGYVRVSGEACDQAILDRLRAAYPGAGIAHAFASTEAGVAFDVRDGLAGFPASWVGNEQGDVRLRVEDGSLHIRSSRTATRYLGDPARILLDPAGFVDTGDMVELRGDRYHFAGRRGGIINFGGLKIHPEVVEAVINQHPAVHMSHVWARRSPVTGALIVADVVLKQPGYSDAPSFEAVRDEILGLCRDRLQPYQVPAMLREAPSLDLTAGGKLVRHRVAHHA